MRPFEDLIKKIKKKYYKRKFKKKKNLYCAGNVQISFWF